MSDNPLDHLCAYCGDAFEDEDSDNPPVLVPADDEVDNGRTWAHTACALANGDLELEEPKEPTLLEQLAEDLELPVDMVRRAMRRLILAQLEEDGPLEDGDLEDAGLMSSAEIASLVPDRPPTLLGLDLSSGPDMTVLSGVHEDGRRAVARLFGVPPHMLGPTRLVPLRDDAEAASFAVSLIPGDVNPFARPAPCDVCGAPGRFRPTEGEGLELALCDDHAAERERTEKGSI